MSRQTLLRWPVCICLALSVLSCGDSQENARNTLTGASLVLPMPDEVFNTRAVITDNLRPELLINGQSLDVARQADGRWLTRFALPASGTAEIVATWFETVTEGTNEQGRLTQEIQLVRSTPISVNANSSRQIVISASSYLASEFDFDNDGTDNLTERRNSTPVFDAREPFSVEHDCRQALFSNLQFSENELILGTPPRGTFNFNQSQIQSLTLLSGPTLPAYLDAILIRRPGTLSIRHTLGTPTDTRIEVYRTPDPNRNISGFSDPAGGRANLDNLAVEPGIYCVVLYAGDDSIDRELSIGTVEIQLTL